MANLKLITMEPPKTIDEQNSPESPISGNSDGLNNYETPLQIPLEREDVKNNSEDNINQEIPEEQSPPSPERLPLPQPNSIFDVEVSPLSVSHSNNNVNSAVEAPLSDDETLEVTDEVEREIDQVGNGERNLADSGLGGRNNNSFTVPLQEPPTNFTMKLDFSLNDLFATEPDNFHSTEQIINNFKWILKINYRKQEQFKGTTIPLSLGIFVQCKGPLNENNRGSCIVNELNFKIHNWNQGVPGLMKTRVCSTPFEPPFTSTTGVWFNLDKKKKMIEEGLVTREDLRIRVSVVLIFRHPHNSNSTQSIPDD
uniref:MATH domain-containing protein n=1 Tax=Meloidogyne incognita TaxID=6306 RepID=A0A914N6D8_MELIC